MTTFDDREQAFEKKFAHDAELKFKVQSRRNRLLGLWAAEKLGKEGQAAVDYAGSVVMSDFDAPGDEDVLKKVLADLQAGGVPVDAHAVRLQMDALLAEAKALVMAE